MDEFVIATYAREMKGSWNGTVSDEWLLGQLYDSIVYAAEVIGKNEELMTVTKTMASELVNRKANVSPKIKKASSDPRVTESIVDYFEKHIVKKIQPNEMNDLIHRINQLIQNDEKISGVTKQELKDMAKERTKAEFLSKTFLLALTKPNKLPKEKSGTGKGKVDVKVLKSVPVPNGIAGDEGNYTDALFAAYGQESGIKNFDVTSLEVYPNYKENFSQQRQYYFAAEAVRRGTRDLYGTREKDQFAVLKDEMFEGVIEVWEDEYKNGLARMRKVMAQATRTALDKCKICRETEWVGNAQRKGVCHFLVGEKRLKGWVRDDDEQTI